MSFLSNIEMNLYKKSMFIHDYDVTGYTNVNLRCLRKKHSSKSGRKFKLRRCKHNLFRTIEE